MKKEVRGLTRRRFVGGVATSATLAALGRLPRAAADGPEKPRKLKMILSFYCDDTDPYTAGAKAFQTFLDYCAEQKIAGESTVRLGVAGRSMSRNPNEEEQAYLLQVKRALQCGIDTHMEVMTHHGLFDFEKNCEQPGAVHEGLWLHEPEVSAEQYEKYFANVIAEGERGGIRFTGLTWPGCGCEACTRRYAELRAKGPAEPNPAVWQALLNLAKQGKFRGRTVPCFFKSSEKNYGIHRKSSDGECAVYDLMPNVMDQFGIWENTPKRVDPDYYISADGKAGIVVRHLEAGAPYCLWYSHWQGLNPAKGVGWRAFTAVIERIRKHLGERVVWLRPSEITDRYHKSGGWGFLDGL
ncbi:MAG: hypothetical protein ABSE73_28705 [Planctomycetota bacterium]